MVLELLKCESYPVDKSHPNRYWHKNWRKFAILWALTRALDGMLLLLNYEVPYKTFKLMRVTEMRPTEDGGLTTEDTLLNLNDPKQFYQRLNAAAVWPWA